MLKFGCLTPFASVYPSKVIPTLIVVEDADTTGNGEEEGF